MKEFGKTIAWVGVLLGAIAPSFFNDNTDILVVTILGRIMAVAGCIFWAYYKKRHWAFGFWGILAPIGFLGVGLLKDGNEKITNKTE